MLHWSQSLDTDTHMVSQTDRSKADDEPLGPNSSKVLLIQISPPVSAGHYYEFIIFRNPSGHCPLNSISSKVRRYSSSH